MLADAARVAAAVAIQRCRLAVSDAAAASLKWLNAADAVLETIFFRSGDTRRQFVNTYLRLVPNVSSQEKY